jgi:hypothetical protein
MTNEFKHSIYSARLESDKKGFCILSFFTESHEFYANRLIKSLINFNYNFIIIKVPKIHASINANGTLDVSYSKPNFILYFLKKINQPIFYLDSDMILKKDITLIEEINKYNYDFSIFNWLQTEDNSAYIPNYDELGNIINYKFSHSINFTSTTQLICSGAAQYWSNSEVSIKLLSFWKKTLLNAPHAQDDNCLDYAFNNLNCSDIKTHWLPKAYCRYGWWIFDEPVIDHPEIPQSRNESAILNELNGLHRFYHGELIHKN